MELAIPLIALGGMYVISNQSTSNNSMAQKSRLERGLKQIQQEEFTNMGGSGALPNTTTPAENYPSSNKKAITSDLNYYQNSNQATGQYLDLNFYENRKNSGIKVSNNIPQIYSLTGNYLDKDNFKHNNMVPFNGGKIRGQLYGIDKSESILDNMIGSGSQDIQKTEQAPLFKPQENVQWANGAPNMSDFFQSRVNPAMVNNNVKPFESKHVAPGLNQGYTTSGSNGYNSGMEARETWLPKTVDQLRIATNPKLEYSLENHEGPAVSQVKNVGLVGKIEKYRPDTFYINSQDRWFTTTGQEKGQTLRPIQEVHSTNRNVTTTSYSGVAGGEKNASYVPTNYTAPKRVVLDPTDVPASSAVGRGPGEANEPLIRNHTNYANNRSTVNQPDTFRNLFGGAIGAAIAPIMDVFKPTRKEEYGDNIRIYGDAAPHVKGTYVQNPGDVPATTVKETTLYSPNSYIGNQSSVGYVLQNHQPVLNQRDTTTTSYTGAAGSQSTSNQGQVSIDSAYRQYNNDKLEPMQGSYMSHGNTQIYNQHMNVNMSKSDNDRNNPRLWVPNASSIAQVPPTKQHMGQMRSKQQYDEDKIGIDRLDSSILDQFRSNPYTQSLHSWVNV